MNYLAYHPIIIHSSHGSGHMNSEDLKIFVGIWIVLNIIWGISWLITGIRYMKYLNNVKEGKIKKYYIHFEYSEFHAGLNFMMIFMWICIVLIYLGILFAKLFL